MQVNGKELDPSDKDGDLVPKLVEKVALPVLHHEIAHCWDRLSTEGTRNAVAAVTDILIYVPATSDPLQELLGAVRSRMAEAVAALEVNQFIPFSSSMQIADNARCLLVFGVN